MVKTMQSVNGMREINKPRVGRALAIALAMLQATGALALPQESDFNAVNGDSTYGVTGSEGTLTITNDNRVVEFGGQGVCTGTVVTSSRRTDACRHGVWERVLVVRML